MPDYLARFADLDPATLDPPCHHRAAALDADTSSTAIRNGCPHPRSGVWM
jgi:hypothetical protein